MRITDTVTTYNGDNIINKYRLLGHTILRVENNIKKTKIKILGISFTFKQSRKLETIINSPFFDSEWYSRYYYRSRINNVTPASDYLRHGNSHNPSPEFYSSEYLLLHPDVAHAKMNPLIHYTRYGWKEKRAISLADLRSYKFPKEAESIRCENFVRNNYENKIVSVVASFSGDGRIADYVVYLLKELQKVSDFIILVCDNPLFKEEINKVKDICNVCLCERHEEYDFGSYKRGWQYLTENKLLNDDDNLLFINDAGYGPVYPFCEIIKHFNSQDVDFYGLSVSRDPKIHLQSFFYIFKNNVYTSPVFVNFILNVKKQISSANVVYNYEMNFTEVLVKGGFKYSSYVDNKKLLPHITKIIPTKYTYTLLKEYKYPIVKIKALQGSTAEKPEDILKYVKQENPILYNIIMPHLTKRLAGIQSPIPNKISKYTLASEYQNTVLKIRQKINEGEKVKIVFLVNMTSMFPAENLMKEMLKDDMFEVKLYIIPDTRFGKKDMIDSLKLTYKELSEKYNFVKLSVEIDENDQICQWNNVIKDADIVCYPSPYDLSYSLYNPYYAAQNGILSIHIDYGFLRSKYDRLIYQSDNYNNFWRVFIETELNKEEYYNYGQCKASNAVVTGYAKMDSLAQYQYDNRDKKTIIIAPHHSVEGGTNPILALSNFETYADLFLKIPEMYPDIDFVFRPHPVLFKILRQKKHWGGKRVDEYLDKMLSHNNVTYSTSGDYFEVFAKSDGIIQDCGSYLVEYFYTKKPCCYMLKSPSDIENKFSELGKQCLDNCYLAYNQEDILDFLNNVIVKGIDPKKREREQFAEKQVMINYPCASAKIISEIKSILKGC